ncbi:hypothetical protein Chor_004496 [Crotalus horridus]
MAGIGGAPAGPRVLVVGAGAAGLGAAQRLLASPRFAHLRLLEASGRAGGRIRSAAFGKGVVEVGAQWIHGPSEGNPVFQVASEAGLLGEEALTEENQRLEVQGHPVGPLAWYSSQGRELKAELAESMGVFFASLLEEARQFVQADRVPVPSLGEYLRDAIAKKLGESPEEEEETRRLKLALLSAYFKMECCVNATDSLDELALGPFGEYLMLPGLDCTFPDGFQGLTDHLLASLPKGTVLFDKPVKTIHWGRSHSEEASTGRFFGVQVECEDGEKFLADHVIVTVPLGFLKEHQESFFCPPLPSQKVEVIHRLGFGTSNKIILEFEQPFWKPDIEIIEVVWENESPLEERSADLKNTWFQNIACYIVLQPPERWHSEPYTKGSYSYIAVGSSGDDIDLLAQPLPEEASDSKIPPQLLFAGEATHRSFFSTTHGALLSGWREANRLIRLYDSLQAPCARLESSSSPHGTFFGAGFLTKDQETS